MRFTSSPAAITRSLALSLVPGLLALTLGLTVLAPMPLHESPASSGTATGNSLSEEAASASESLATESESARQTARLLAELQVDRWHAAGYRGRGVKIAILDSGFRGYREHLGKALPPNVSVRSFRVDGNLEAKDSQHGILCGEVIHMLAPEAELLFANWEPDHPEAFLAATRWAREQGAQVISCSVIMPSYSDGEGGGPIHQALTRVLGGGTKASDLLCFACAGNTAQRHWAGPFSDGGDGFHYWNSQNKGNELRPWGNERVSVELYWQPGTDYDLIVQDATSGAEVGRSDARPELKRCGSVVRFQPQTQHTYQVFVRLAHGQAETFHLVALGAGLQYATASGSIPFPADGAEVIAVGAVDTTGRRMEYSSCGPNSKHPKPDLVAPVPFPSQWRARPFGGTSAAAPQAAGLAALLWSRHPTWAAREVREALRSSAWDLGPPGHDYETGYGRVRLPDSASHPPFQFHKTKPVVDLLRFPVMGPNPSRSLFPIDLKP